MIGRNTCRPVARPDGRARRISPSPAKSALRPLPVLEPQRSRDRAQLRQGARDDGPQEVAKCRAAPPSANISKQGTRCDLGGPKNNSRDSDVSAAAAFHAPISGGIEERMSDHIGGNSADNIVRNGATPRGDHELDDQLGAIAQLWSAGLPLSEIARELGEATRSAIAGKIQRARRKGDTRFQPRSPKPKLQVRRAKLLSDLVGAVRRAPLKPTIVRRGLRPSSKRPGC